MLWGVVVEDSWGAAHGIVAEDNVFGGAWGAAAVATWKSLRKIFKSVGHATFL